jgi:hypothetical protein
MFSCKKRKKESVAIYQFDLPNATYLTLTCMYICHKLSNLIPFLPQILMPARSYLAMVWS